jgi:hypothetical protein
VLFRKRQRIRKMRSSQAGGISNDCQHLVPQHPVGGPCKIGGVDSARVGHEQAAEAAQFSFKLQPSGRDAGIRRLHAVYGISPACSIQPLLAPEIPERADIRKVERKSEKVLIPDVGDGVAPVFERNAAAVPVVGGLSCCEL